MKWFRKRANPNNDSNMDGSMRQDTTGSVVKVADLSLNNEYKCRICIDLGDADTKMCAPCLCTGSVKYIHVTCLKEWIKEKRSIKCELCGSTYKKKVRTKVTVVDKLGLQQRGHQKR